MDEDRGRIKVYQRYPWSSVLIYNGVTVVHFVLGAMGIVAGYGNSPLVTALAWAYLAFAFVEMYVIMPFAVCRHCAYYFAEDALCVSGLNVVSRRVARPGKRKRFAERADGFFSHNTAYMGALFLPIAAMIPALFLSFSARLLIILLLVVGLLLLRFFVIFPKIACGRCAAKYDCPNAASMGLDKT